MKKLQVLLSLSLVLFPVQAQANEYKRLRTHIVWATNALSESCTDLVYIHNLKKTYNTPISGSQIRQTRTLVNRCNTLIKKGDSLSYSTHEETNYDQKTNNYLIFAKEVTKTMKMIRDNY